MAAIKILLNKFGEKELPEKFAANEYQVLLVADKYQYGFDQLLLHTMYNDERYYTSKGRLHRKIKVR